VPDLQYYVPNLQYYVPNLQYYVPNLQYYVPNFFQISCSRENYLKYEKVEDNIFWRIIEYNLMNFDPTKHGRLTFPWQNMQSETHQPERISASAAGLVKISRCGNILFIKTFLIKLQLRDKTCNYKLY
jgi:hypothetical protein